MTITKEVAAKKPEVASKNEIGKLVSSKVLIGRDVSVTCTNRTEFTYSGVLQSIEEQGIVIKYESRGSLYTTFLPFANILDISIKEPVVS